MKLSIRKKKSMTALNMINSSIWLKPMLKCVNAIIDCETPKLIKYSEIKRGNIINLEFKDKSNNTYTRTYIATSNWEENGHSACLINLYGKQIVVSKKAFEDLSVSILGSFKV